MKEMLKCAAPLNDVFFVCVAALVDQYCLHTQIRKHNICVDSV